MARAPSAFERRNTRGGQLPRFLSREAGQARTQNLKAVEQSILDTIRYYGGPGLGDTIPAALNAAPELLPGADVRDAVLASGDLAAGVRNRDAWQGMFGGLGLLGSMGMAVLPGTASGLRGAVDEVAGAGARAASPSAAAAEALDPLAGPAVPPAIRAYHGTPHSFDRFDISKIGTGEGAQAYGRGLYFAENEGTAKSYRNALSQGGSFDITRPDGTRITRSGHDTAGVVDDLQLKDRPRYVANYVLDMLRGGKNIDEAVAETHKAYGHFPAEDMQKGLDAIRAADPVLHSKGSMYEVNIKADPESLLDWDAPLSETEGALPKYLAHIGKTPDDAVAAHREFESLSEEFLKTGDPATMERWNAMHHDPLVRVGGLVNNLRKPVNPFGYDAASKMIGQRLVDAIGKSDEGAAALRAAGIPGIKYLDKGSRGLGEGTSNYVVFDDKLIDIVRKYGIAALLGGGAAGAAATNGRDDRNRGGGA